MEYYFDNQVTLAAKLLRNPGLLSIEIFLNEYLLSLCTNVKIGKFSNLCSL